MYALPLPDPPLQTETIRLRLWGTADIAGIVAACTDPSTPAYLPHMPSPYRESDAVSWLAVQEPNRLAGISLELAVADAQSDEALGAITAGSVDMTQLTASIGYWLAPHARGQGYMTSAVRLFARWLFDRLGLARLELTVDPENLASQRVAERCHFRREGYLRSHTLIRHSGQRRDSLIYGLLPDDLT